MMAIALMMEPASTKPIRMVKSFSCGHYVAEILAPLGRVACRRCRFVKIFRKLSGPV
jgi:hypothetical protein